MLEPLLMLFLGGSIGGLVIAMLPAHLWDGGSHGKLSRVTMASSDAPTIPRSELSGRLQRLMFLRVLFVSLLLGASVFVEVKENEDRFRQYPDLSLSADCCDLLHHRPLFIPLKRPVTI